MPLPFEIDVWQGEIAELEVDAIVVPAVESLFMTGRVAASVKRHAGEEVERDAVGQGPIGPGDAVATHGGSLAARWIIHAVAVGHDLRTDPAQVRRATRRSLELARALTARTLAISPLASDRGSSAAIDSADLLLGELDELPQGVFERVVIAVASPADYVEFASALERSRAVAG